MKCRCLSNKIFVMWRRKTLSSSSLSLSSESVQGDARSDGKVSVLSAVESMRPHDEVTVLSDLQNENKLLREQLFEAYNQIAWLHREKDKDEDQGKGTACNSQSQAIDHSALDIPDTPHCTATSTTTSNDLTNDNNPTPERCGESDDERGHKEKEEEAVKNSSLGSKAKMMTSRQMKIGKMVLTRDVGTMIDRNIFLIDEIERRDAEEGGETDKRGKRRERRRERETRKKESKESSSGKKKEKEKKDEEKGREDASDVEIEVDTMQNEDSSDDSNHMDKDKNEEEEEDDHDEDDEDEDEVVNHMTYESRYYQQKLLNSTLDQRILYLEGKCERLEEKMVTHNQLRLEAASLRLTLREALQAREALEKALYQQRFESQRWRERCSEEEGRRKEVEQETQSLLERITECEDRLAVLLRENQSMSLDLSECRDRIAAEQRRFEAVLLRDRAMESKCESQSKEILRLQLQLELSQSRLSFTPLCPASPMPMPMPMPISGGAMPMPMSMSKSMSRSRSEESFEISRHSSGTDPAEVLSCNQIQIQIQVDRRAVAQGMHSMQSYPASDPHHIHYVHIHDTQQDHPHPHNPHIPHSPQTKSNPTLKMSASVPAPTPALGIAACFCGPNQMMD